MSGSIWKIRRIRLLPALAGMVMFSALASATPMFGTIVGTFGFSGPGVMAFQSIPGSDFIRFCTKADSNCTGPATATGDFGASGPGAGSFTNLVGIDTGAILNVTDHTPPLSPYTYLPVGVPVIVDNYLSLTSINALANYNLDFQADIVPLASCVPTLTQVCVGPFQLNQNGPNVSVTLDVLGTLINKQDNSKSSMDVTITGQFNSTTILAVAAAATSPGGAFSNSWSGTVNAAAIPEPGTASTVVIGFGLVALGMARRYRSRT